MGEQSLGISILITPWTAHAADEAWYWLSHILCSGLPYIGSRPTFSQRDVIHWLHGLEWISICSFRHSYINWWDLNTCMYEWSVLNKTFNFVMTRFHGVLICIYKETKLSTKAWNGQYSASIHGLSSSWVTSSYMNLVAKFYSYFHKCKHSVCIILCTHIQV